MQLQLQGVSGSLAGQAITLPLDGGVVGRGSACRVVLPDDLASRQHAAFAPAPGPAAGGAGWTVTDLGSTNGTRVNGRMIPAQQPVAVQPGDQVQIGGSAFRVMLAPATAAAPPVGQLAQGAGQGKAAPAPAARAVIVAPAPATGQGQAQRASPWIWLGRLLAALGGALLVAGAFLPWLQVTVTPTLLGFSLGEQSALIGGLQGFGPLTLAIGALLLAVVVLDVLLRSPSRWPGVAVLALAAAGLVVMGIGAATFEASSQQMAQQLGQAFGIDLPGVLESDLFQEILAILGDVIQPQLALREGVALTAAGLLLALLGGVSRTVGSRQ
jgi:hypothetical protein